MSWFVCKPLPDNFTWCPSFVCHKEQVNNCYFVLFSMLLCFYKFLLNPTSIRYPWNSRILDTLTSPPIEGVPCLCCTYCPICMCYFTFFWWDASSTQGLDALRIIQGQNHVFCCALCSIPSCSCHSNCLLTPGELWVDVQNVS